MMRDQRKLGFLFVFKLFSRSQVRTFGDRLTHFITGSDIMDIAVLPVVGNEFDIDGVEELIVCDTAMTCAPAIGFHERTSFTVLSCGHAAIAMFVSIDASQFASGMCKLVSLRGAGFDHCGHAASILLPRCARRRIFSSCDMQPKRLTTSYMGAILCQSIGFESFPNRACTADELFAFVRDETFAQPWSAAAIRARLDLTPESLTELDT